MLATTPENKLELSCRIGIDAPIPLSRLVSNYIGRCEDVIVEIIVRG